MFSLFRKGQAALGAAPAGSLASAPADSIPEISPPAPVADPTPAPSIAADLAILFSTPLERARLRAIGGCPENRLRNADRRLAQFH